MTGAIFLKAHGTGDAPMADRWLDERHLERAIEALTSVAH